MSEKSISVRRVLDSEWEIYKQLRLKSLKSNPEAFGAKFDEAVLRPDTEWQKQTQNFATSKEAVNFIALYNENPVGLVSSYISDKAEMFQMWVDSDVRGIGIGKQLVLNLKTWLKDIGETTLYATVYKDNTPALKLYQNLGFIEIGTSGREIHLSCKL